MKGRGPSSRLGTCTVNGPPDSGRISDVSEATESSAMPTPKSWPDAREVDRIEVLVTANDRSRIDAFLERCRPGSIWSVRIRTAEVDGEIRARRPLGSFDERDCTCLSIRLSRPVPVEPGLRLQIASEDDPSLTASAVIRPWGG
jgi:translation elongation factor EF-Tu-like GTPase